MGKQAPASPNYSGAAQEQADSSANAVGQQTTANRPNQATPFASSQWHQNPDGSWTQSVGLAGGLGAAAGGLGDQAATLGQGLDWSQFGSVGTGDNARQQAIESAFAQSKSRLDPMFAEREGKMTSGLANAGLDPNSQAYRNAQQSFGQQRNDAYQGALNSAIAQGTAAGDSVFRNNIMARQQAIAEALKQRAQPLDEMAALQRFLNMPSFMGAQAADPTQYLTAAGMQGNYNLGAFDAQNRANADAFGGGMELVKGASFFLPLFLL